MTRISTQLIDKTLSKPLIYQFYFHIVDFSKLKPTFLADFNKMAIKYYDMNISTLILNLNFILYIFFITCKIITN